MEAVGRRWRGAGGRSSKPVIPGFLNLFAIPYLIIFLIGSTFNGKLSVSEYFPL